MNADVIASGLSAYSPAGISLKAGKLMIGRLRELAVLKQDYQPLADSWAFYDNSTGWLPKLIATEGVVAEPGIWATIRGTWGVRSG